MPHWPGKALAALVIDESVGVMRKMNILIVYGTTEGHTRHVCHYIQSVLSEAGAGVTICDATREVPDPAPYDICFVAGSLHAGNYQSSVVDYVRRHHDALNGKRSAFLSVSLSAAGENTHDWEGLEQCVARFTHATSWIPTVVHHVAGAIRYSQYDFFKRLALKYIAHKRGQETVTSRDYDLTDYDDLKQFVLGFIGHKEKVPA
jgi:menaquinone-dependent protoporphyrinogen oxidase